MDVTQEDRERIAAAVAKAEATTAGEITCVLADEVSDYPETPLVWATGAALILPAFALFMGLRPQMLTDMFGGWTVAHAAANDAAILSALGTYVAVQVAVFIVAAVVVSLPPVRRFLTPKWVKAERVHKAATEQFLARGLHLTKGRTGVLLFASLAEHRAEVIADEGIYNVAPRQVWDEVVALMIAGLKRGSPAEGFEGAIARAGQILAEHVPPDGDNPNETPDDLTVLPSRRRKKPT